MSDENKTLEELENDRWIFDYKNPTGMIEEIFALRKKPIGNFSSNELRLMITQNIGLKYLVPRALRILQNNILEEALYYPGDLLSSFFNIKDVYWHENPSQKQIFSELLRKSKGVIDNSTDIDKEIKMDLDNAIRRFLNSSN